MRSRPPESSAKSRRRPRQGRPDVPAKVVEALLESQQIRPRQSLCMESPLESSNKPRQARPVSVTFTRQALQGRPPSQSRPPSSAVHAKVVRCPCQSPAKSADRPVGRQGLFARQSSTVAARLALQAPCQSCPPSPLVPAKLFLGCPVLVKPQSSAVPARVVRVPARVARQVPVESVPESSGYRQSRPDSCTVPSALLFLESPPESSTKSPPASSAVPARFARHPRQGRSPSSLSHVPSPPGFSRWEIRVPNFTIVPHG